jgi:hypothetical protein
MDSQQVKRLADHLIDSLSDLDKDMAMKTVALYEIMAKADPETMKYVEGKFQGLLRERTERMQDVMASKAAKDVTNRRARETPPPMILMITPLMEMPSLLAHREVVCECDHSEARHGLFGGSCDRDGCDCREFRPGHMGP